MGWVSVSGLRKYKVLGEGKQVHRHVPLDKKESSYNSVSVQFPHDLLGSSSFCFQLARTS